MLTGKNVRLVNNFKKNQSRFSPSGLMALAVASVAATLMPAQSARATSDTWTGSTDGVWATATNWLGGNAPGSADTATFNAASANTTIDLGAGVNLTTLLFDTSSVGAYTIGAGAAGSQTLSLANAGALTMNSTVTANEIINANLSLNAAANASAIITNNSSGLLTINGGILGNVASGNGLLTVADTGNVVINGAVTKPGAGSMALLKTGSGTLTLSANTTWSGTGALGRVPATSAGFPLVAREGTLLFSSGTHNVTGELVIGGVVADGGAGQNAKIQIDGGTLAVTGFFSVGRGNGIGAVSSDFVANNGATITAANVSAGFNGGNAANLPKGNFTLNNTSTFTITGNGVLNFAESAGSNFTMNLNDSSQLIAAGTGVKFFGGAGATAVANLGGSAALNLSGTGITYIGFQSGNGTLNQTGGTLTTGGDLRVAGTATNLTGAGGSGTYNLSGGTATVSSLTVSRGNNNTYVANGTVNVSGGTLTSINDMVLGFAGNGNLGRLNITGGTVNVATTATKWLIMDQFDTAKGQLDVSGTGALKVNANSSIMFTTGNTSTSGNANVINMNGGTITFYSDNGTTVGGTGVIDLARSGSATANNSLNLNGGTLTVPQIISNTVLPTRTLNFNGGTLKAAINTTNFVNLNTGANQAANVRNSGAIIDSNGFNVTIPQVLQHSAIGGDNAIDGGLTKQGAGTLSLTGASTFTGTTNVNAGALRIDSAGSINSTAGITVNGGKLINTSSVAMTPTVTLTSGTVDGTGTIGTVNAASSASAIVANGNGTASALTINNLNYTDLGAMNLIVGTAGGSPVLNTTAFNTGTVNANKISLNISNTGTWTAGTYPLIGYTSLTAYSEIALGTVTGMGSRLSGTLSNSGSQIILTVAGDNPRWTGALSSEWSTATLANPKNWALITSATPTDYINGDVALFDDTATGYTVDVSVADVTATSVTFNANNNYTLQGSKAITGTTGLSKQGTGTLTINNTNNYTGATSVNAGQIDLNGGLSGSSVTVASGATLNESSTGVIAGSASMTVSGSATLAGANTFNGGVTANSGATLNINNASALGTGTLTYNGATLDNTSGVAITNSNINPIALNANMTFTGSNNLNLGSGAVTMNASRTINVVNNTLTVGGAISGVGFNLTKDGAGTLALGGSSTYTGTTNILNGEVVLTGALNGPNAANMGQINVGTVSGQTGTLTVNGGTINATKTSRPSMVVGTVAGSTGVLNLNSGAINTTSEFWLGNNVGSNVTMNMTGGTVTTGTWSVVGFNNDVVVLNQSGGTFTVSTNRMTIGAGGTGANGTYNLSGGSFVASSGTGGMYVGENGTGIMNITGTGSADAALIGIGQNAGAQGLLNLNGGTLTAGTITGGAGTSVMYLDGGTLKARAANTNWISNVGTLQVKAGGANIDTNTFNTTISQAINDDGNNGTFTKTGTGTLTLSGNNGYAGATVVNNGTLLVGGAGTLSSSGITVNGASAKFATSSTSAVTPPVAVTLGTVDGTGTINTVNVVSNASNTVANGLGTSSVLTIGSLNFAGNGAFSVNVSAPTAVGVLATSGISNAGGVASVTVNATNTSWTNGSTYDLVGYGTGLTGTGFSAYVKGTIAGLTSRQSATLINDIANSAIALSIAGDSPKWTGALSNAWNTSTMAAPKNWKLITGGTQTDYIETLGVGDTVLFDDTATGSTSVNIDSATVTPQSVTFNNTTKNYTISSSSTFGIGGTGTLTKSGTGTVTLNTANSYSGGTTLSAGQLNINKSTSIGTGALTINGGSIDNTSGTTNALTTNNTINVNSDINFVGSNELYLGSGNLVLGGTPGTRTVNVGGNILGTGSLTNGDNYSITKTGAGIWTINPTAISYIGGPLTVNGGKMQIGNFDFKTGYSSANVPQGTGGLSGSGIIENGSSTARWVYDSQNSNTTFTGTLQDGTGGATLGLLKEGTGTLTLSGTNTPNNTITVANGGLVISGTTSTGGASTPVVVGNVSGQTATLDITGTLNENRTTAFQPAIQIGSASGATGIVNVSGNLTTGTEVWVSSASGGNGTLNVTGGTTTINSYLAVGRGGNAGTLNISGGSVTVNNNTAVLASFAGNVGSANITGGTLTANADLKVGEAGTGTLTVSGTGAVVVNGTIGLGIGQLSGSTGVVDLNGGSITAPKVYSAASGSNSAFDFNGGTLRANASSTTFMQGLSAAYIRDNGATIDSNGNNITIAQTLQHSGFGGDAAIDGGLTKTGAGTLTLSTATAYTGQTTVNGGKLVTNLAIQNSAPLTLATGGVLEVPTNGTSTGVTVVKSVSSSGTGSHIELHDNDLVIDYSVAGVSNYTSIYNQVKSGLVLLGGTGEGIGSTDVDNQTVQGTILAVVDDGDANIAGAITSTSGYTLANPAASVIVKYTWFGDSNLDGIVDGSDYALLDSGFTSGGALGGWVFGDYDYSGQVDGSDYALIDTGFISQNAVLPEPTTLGLLGLGAMGALRRRRRAN